MITGSEPAMPVHGGREDDPRNGILQGGLSKREHFAAMAMQGMASACHGFDSNGLENLAKCAVIAADALIAELNKPTI